jgi:hypothetical protein
MLASCGKSSQVCAHTALPCTDCGGQTSCARLKHTRDHTTAVEWRAWSQDEAPSHHGSSVLQNWAMHCNRPQAQSYLCARQPRQDRRWLRTVQTACDQRHQGHVRALPMHCSCRCHQKPPENVVRGNVSTLVHMRMARELRAHNLILRLLTISSLLWFFTPTFYNLLLFRSLCLLCSLTSVICPCPAYGLV